MSDLYMSYKVMESNEGQAVQTISSREVANMMEVKRHSHMLEKIDKLNQILLNQNIGSADYWIESSYKDDSGKRNKEYQVTKKGCELIAHKTEGTKGVVFTVRYMEKFNEMQSMIQEQQPKLPTSYKEALQQLLVQVEENEKLVIENKEKEKFIKQIEGSQNTLLVREVAKVISANYGIKIGEKQLYKKLREWGWVFEKTTEAKQEALRRGYLEVREGIRETTKGVFTFHTTRVTGKGQRKILEKLLEELEVATNE